MASDLKIPKSYSLDPIVASWVTQKAALEALRNGAKMSDSEIVNAILTEAMNNDSVSADVAHLKNFDDKKLRGKK